MNLNLFTLDIVQSLIMDLTSDKNATSQIASTRPLHQLCGACLSSFPRHGEWSFESFCRQHPWCPYLMRQCTLKDLQNSANTGCHLCTMMLHVILRRQPSGTGFKFGLFLWDWKVRHAYTIGTFLNGEELDTKLEIRPLSTFQTDRPSVKIERLPSLDSNLGATPLEMARNWLQVCQHNHTQCRPPKSTSTPWAQQSKYIRLISIQSQDNGTQTYRLIEHPLDENVDYMTLSYRWTDEVKKNMLLGENKERFYESIPTDGWPQIYRDAVKMTGYFHVQYLWIDALCIVQDDPRDWEEQADLMNIIYERGILNLAAVMGEGEPGLHGFRDPLSMFDCLLTRESGEPWVCANVEDELDVLARFPLYQRGWTFQERLLSNRTLHFGRQLVWECDAGLATEVCPELITTKHDATRTIKRTFAGSQYKFPPPRMLVGAFSALWKMVVVSFSKMQLTYSSDKLPALQGITNRLGYRLSLDPADYYVAGLWVVECSQLSWLRESHQNWLTSEDNEVACKPCKKPPSWSWTVCAGAVKIPGGAFQPIDLVVLGAVPVRSRGAGLRHMVTVHECISTVLFKDNAAAREPEPFTGLILRGKFIHWFQIHTILQLGQRTPKFTIKGYVPTDASKSGSFNIKIILDRPIPEHSSHKGLKLLPIHCNRSQGSSPDEMCGILLEFLGFDEGMALYCRLGQFQVVDLEGSPSCFLRYFHLPRERGTAETHEMPVGLQQELDELPPFEVI